MRTRTGGVVVPDTTAPLLVGGVMSGSGAAFKGAVANVAIYPYALSASQVEAHYALK